MSVWLSTVKTLPRITVYFCSSAGWTEPCSSSAQKIPLLYNIQEKASSCASFSTSYQILTSRVSSPKFSLIHQILQLWNFCRQPSKIKTNEIYFIQTFKNCLNFIKAPVRNFNYVLTVVVHVDMRTAYCQKDLVLHREILFWKNYLRTSYRKYPPAFHYR